MNNTPWTIERVATLSDESAYSRLLWMIEKAEDRGDNDEVALLWTYATPIYHRLNRKAVEATYC